MEFVEKEQRSKKTRIVVISAAVIALALLVGVGWLIVKVTSNQQQEVVITSDASSGGTDSGNGLSLGGASSTENDKNLSLIGGGSGGSQASSGSSTGSSSSTSSSKQSSASSGSTSIPPPGSSAAAPKPVRSQTLPNGLKIEEFVYGTEGRATKSGDTVAMHYVGYLTNGTVFDTSLKGAKTPFAFKLGTGQVIPGWDIGLQDMRVGAVRRLTIPASLAYGANGSPPSIPANATLIFDVQLMAIQ